VISFSKLSLSDQNVNPKSEYSVYIEFESSLSAFRAISGMKDTLVDGKKLYLDLTGRYALQF
jgi:hypothetical protein